MDIDFSTTLDVKNNTISIEPGTKAVSGNRALLNQFEIVMLTKWKKFFYPETKQVTEVRFGGNSSASSSSLHATDKTSIMAAMTASIRNTVQSIQLEQSNLSLPDTEKLDSATLEALDTYGDQVVSVINVVPVETEPQVDLKLNLPVINIKEY